MLFCALAFFSGDFSFVGSHGGTSKINSLLHEVGEVVVSMVQQHPSPSFHSLGVQELTVCWNGFLLATFWLMADHLSSVLWGEGGVIPGDPAHSCRSPSFPRTFKILNPLC